MSQKTSDPVPPQGILLLNKPVGITSFQSLGAVKKYFNTKKIGHTGTLDKFASGLMIVLVGKMTRLNPVFTGMDKTYEGVIRFGQETDTLDPEGVVVHQSSIPLLSLIEEGVAQLTGTLEQIPPFYSAIHINGMRSWQLARAGKPVEMKSRTVRIDHFEILDWSSPFLSVRVSCSSGTYIRSLARDLALVCESRASLWELNRTRVGNFTLDEARSPQDELLNKGLYSLYDMMERLPFQGSLMLSNDESAKVRLGIPPENFLGRLNFSNPGLFPLFHEDKTLAALLKYDGARLAYQFVM